MCTYITLNTLKVAVEQALKASCVDYEDKPAEADTVESEVEEIS